MRIATAFLVALSATFGAATAWKASDAAIHADEQDRAGFHRKIEDITITTQVLGKRETIAAAYLRWLAHDRYARALGADARHSSPAAAQSLRIDAKVEQLVARRAWTQVPRLARAGAGKIDLAQADRIDTAELEQATSLAVVPPAAAFSDADRLRAKAERLVLIAAFFIVAAVAFTLAQVRPRREVWMWLAIGLAILLGSMIAGLWIEIGT
jgi:hypothetical protein